MIKVLKTTQTKTSRRGGYSTDKEIPPGLPVLYLPFWEMLFHMNIC